MNISINLLLIIKAKKHISRYRIHAVKIRANLAFDY